MHRFSVLRPRYKLGSGYTTANQIDPAQIALLPYKPHLNCNKCSCEKRWVLKKVCVTSATPGAYLENQRFHYLLLCHINSQMSTINVSYIIIMHYVLYMLLRKVHKSVIIIIAQYKLNYPLTDDPKFYTT